MGVALIWPSCRRWAVAKSHFKGITMMSKKKYVVTVESNEEQHQDDGGLFRVGVCVGLVIVVHVCVGCVSLESVGSWGVPVAGVLIIGVITYKVVILLASAVRRCRKK